MVGDTNGARDVFVHDRETGETARVSLASDGEEGNDGSRIPSISADGRYVAFYSYATNLVPGDTNGALDVFVHDREAGETERVSLASDGTQGNSGSSTGFARTHISAGGRYVVFWSVASNLVPGDTNGLADVFVHDRNTGVTARVSRAADGTEANGRSRQGSISADGRYGAFDSLATNLVPGDTNEAEDVFVASNPLFKEPATCNGLAATIVGTEGEDTLLGTTGDDVIAAMNGNDVIRALGGNDLVCAGPGNDLVVGGPGRERLYGEGGRDVLWGGGGRDRLYGGPGRDMLKGQGGGDRLLGGGGPDRLIGGGGSDVLKGQGGNDVLLGNLGDDRLIGGAGDDDMDCGSGADAAKGGAGTDTVVNCETASGVP